jgi:predicted CDP-diglyceride synthetase/phosphatidate cytidylyltransferase
MNSRICNIEKFKFVLGLYKSILHKSATLFANLRTEPLLNAAFQDWLFETEITTTRAEEVREFYFKNVYSLEFLIVMALYYLDTFPENIYKVAIYMRNISLLEDNKEFLDNQSILQYMQHFHDYVQDGEYFRHFLASHDYS